MSVDINLALPEETLLAASQVVALQDTVCSPQDPCLLRLFAPGPITTHVPTGLKGKYNLWSMRMYTTL